MHVLVMPGELTTAIGAIGDPEGVRELGLEGMPGVDRVVPISRPVQARVARSSRTTSRARSTSTAARVGGDATFCLIAGPCTVESREQTLEVARIVKDGGRVDAARRRVQAAHVAVRVQGPRRAGAGDPRRGARGDRPAGRHRVPGHASTPTAIAEHADVVQIGARNMQNYALLEVAGKLGKPVLLKRGLSSSLDELLMAADYVLKEGNEHVMLCERGIRTFETATRFTLDLSAIPWLKLHTHLPVIVDPEPRLGRPPAGRAAGPRGGRGRRRRHHRRGPPGPRRRRSATGRRRSTGATSPSSRRASPPTRASTAA